MKVQDIAQEIYRELDEPSDLTIPVIAFWIRSNVGELNNHLDTAFKINDTSLEIERFDTNTSTRILIDREAKAILKKMYMVHHYGLKLREILGAAASDPLVEVTSDGARVRKINKNELGKTYAQVKKAEYEELLQLIAGYRKFSFTPIQVAGDDTVEGNPRIYNIQYNRLRY